MMSFRPKGVSRKISAKLCREEVITDEFVGIIKRMCDGSPNVLDLTEIKKFSDRGEFEKLLTASILDSIPDDKRRIISSASNVMELINIFDKWNYIIGIIDKKGILHGKF